MDNQERHAHILHAPVDLLSLGQHASEPGEACFTPLPPLDTILRRVMGVVEASGVLSGYGGESNAVMCFKHADWVSLEGSPVPETSADMSMARYIKQALATLGVATQVVGVPETDPMARIVAAWESSNASRDHNLDAFILMLLTPAMWERLVDAAERYAAETPFRYWTAEEYEAQ